MYLDNTDSLSSPVRSTCQPGLDSDDTHYLAASADTWFKVKRFIEYSEATGRNPVSAILETTTVEPSVFKEVWKRFQELFARKYDVEGIGTWERSEGGVIHAHFLLLFGERHRDEEVFGEIAIDWRRTWTSICERAGRPIAGKRMALERPHDGKGWKCGRYLSKAYNRGVKRAKSGKDGSQSFLLTLRLRGKALWKPSELPRKWLTTHEQLTTWLEKELEYEAGDICGWQNACLARSPAR